MGAAGKWNRASEPRLGSDSPRTIIVTMITRSGRPAWSPMSGSQSASVCQLSSSDWVMPIARPATVVRANDWKPPTRAAASAGTIRRLNWAASRLNVMLPIRIMATAASTVAIIQLTAAM